MTSFGPSPFSMPFQGLRIKRGTPALRRPTREEIESFPGLAVDLLEETWRAQHPLVESGAYDLRWMEGRHLLLAGATGSGLGGRLAMAALRFLGDRGSLTILARDLKRSLGYESGVVMNSWAERAGLGTRFQWLNCGMALEGERIEQVVQALRHAGADRVVYVNTVAAASCGLLPGFPPVFVKDVDEEGAFQWELCPLDERSIEATRTIMGTLAVEYPRCLEQAGIPVEATVFADYRGSLDRSSRDPSSPDYGRQGAYSTSLFLPKQIIQEATSQAYGTGRILLDVFLPVMRTPALAMIPGGVAMYRLYQRLHEREGVARAEVPELALGVLDRIGRNLRKEDDNPFPRLDAQEASLDLCFWEVVRRINQDEQSDFYYRRWL
jgi:hypothetical protein